VIAMRNVVIIFCFFLLVVATDVLYAQDSGLPDPIATATAEGQVRYRLDACAFNKLERSKAMELSDRLIMVLSKVTGVSIDALHAAMENAYGQAKINDKGNSLSNSPQCGELQKRCLLIALQRRDVDAAAIMGEEPLPLEDWPEGKIDECKGKPTDVAKATQDSSGAGMQH